MKIKQVFSISILFALIASFAIPESAAAAKARRRVVKTDKLLADRVKPSYEEGMMDSLLLAMELELEEEMYPSNDLYAEQWNTQYAHHYQGIEVPDSFILDVSAFVMPVATRGVTSNYGWRRGRMHYGTDFGLRTGDTIVAAFDGKVRIKSYDRGGYGYYLVLRHPNGLETVYGHLSGFLVYQDQYVKAGQAIALGGSTGRSTGPHLHFEFRFIGQAINPAEILDLKELALKDDQYTFIKKKSSLSSTSAKYAASGSGKIQYYRIKEGDSLSSIAKKYRTTVTNLCRLNNIKTTTTLRVGHSLRVS
ncbi:MAG: peptidoglycan DD-metalloendopeptidase family protein [Candidatus Symbiothrix sp.]|jgi:murein DD-endopeptidase MepM/ murein hydrolase activator NlpD|nr:peptidoglycan DD-metalloendopeptidase family protein [Candidatus Symbiothrix sp.]